jgi:hypothetical protein
MIGVQLPELLTCENVGRMKVTKTKRRGSNTASEAHLAIKNIKVLVTEVLREFVYIILFIKCNECIRNVRIGYVAQAQRVAEVARVEVQYLLDDALAIPVLKLRRRLEKIKPGVSVSHVSHDVSKI